MNLNCENRLIDVLIVNILLFLLWRNKYILHLTSFTCASSACLWVRFWLIVCENLIVKL